MSHSPVTLADVRAARERLDDEDVVRTTPVDTSRSLSAMVGADVHLKMEHLQRTGSFKTRGAYNRIAQVGADVDRVVAASAGNHAQGVALAATKAGIDATIVMPTSAPQTKVDATRDYGATVELHGGDFPETMAYARDLADRDGRLFVHAFDDPAIVAGQGTLGLEVAEQVPDLDTVVVPVGGGGLIGGVATALKGLDAAVRVVGVQAEHAATVPESLERGEPVSIEHPRTIADGIATGGISELTFDLVRRHVDEVVVVSDEEIARAILVLLERAKQLVEGAGAASVAALLSGAVDAADETVVPILAGGNIDPSMLQTVLTFALTDRQQLLRLRIRIRDEPGRMGELATLLADQGVNIREVRHDRAVGDLEVGEAYLVFHVVAGGAEHAARVIETVEAAGYEVSQVN
ncbi:MAG: threonine ammonia-lyase [Haloferacaceae archaeon]